MKRIPFFALLLLLTSALVALGADAKKPEKPLNILLITGGCCHNYPFQSKALKDGVSKSVNSKWTIVNDGGTGTSAKIDFYNNKDWAKPYDVVIHNECFAKTVDPEYIRKITRAHRAGVPAVVIHCAMHTYRDAKIDDWREFLGVTSRRHDHQSKYAVKKTLPNHPTMKDLPNDWVTPMDELYIIEKLWPRAKALATSVSEKDGKAHAVFWTNRFGNARVFGTTYGHSDDTFREPVFIKTIANGVLWSTGNLKSGGKHRDKK